MNEPTLPQGFRFAGVHCGLRPDPDRLDLALFASDTPASAAGAFTQNRVRAAPVRWCQGILPRGDARAIVVCSGNANACTGQRGLDDARAMAAVTAQSLDCGEEQVLVCSTGVIGRPLPMPKLAAGIPQAAAAMTADGQGLDRAAHAILTTDTRSKVRSGSVLLEGHNVRLLGVAKGAAMIGPNMATMLAFVLTDAAVRPEDLAALAPVAAERSFNSISVEGHTSTNDSLLFLANGAGPPLTGQDLETFGQAVTALCADLARDIAADAEGASHVITIEVEGTRTEAEARKIAKSVADSALVKTAFFGADPNWGRIVSAAGYAGVEFEEEQMSLWLGDYLLYEKGVPLEFDAPAVSAFIRANRELTCRLAFTLGRARCTFYTCDLTYDYVRLNADYTT